MMLRNVHTGIMVDVYEYFEKQLEAFKEIYPDTESRTAEDFEYFINEDTAYEAVDDDGEELEEPTAEYYAAFTWAATKI